MGLNRNSESWKKKNKALLKEREADRKLEGMTQNTRGKKEKKINKENGEKGSRKKREVVQYMFSKASIKVMERGLNFVPFSV